mmetsp:Transcript_30659/g.86720  ORF Transcript_30659/g.86720 Transcript_30659/m.86720 type:complete len:1056 (-) Transcript_30659:200-3367(-)
MDQTSATRQKLDDVAKLPYWLAYVLVELQRDVQPPEVCVYGSKAEEALTSLCWSLLQCKTVAKTLTGKTTAIRGLLPSRKGAETGEQEDRDKQQEEDAAPGGEAEEGLQERVKQRDRIRGRLVAHLRDAMQVAAQQVAPPRTPLEEADDAQVEGLGEAVPLEKMACRSLLQRLMEWYQDAAESSLATADCCAVLLKTAWGSPDSTAHPPEATGDSAPAGPSSDADKLPQKADGPVGATEDQQLSNPLADREKRVKAVQRRCKAAAEGVAAWREGALSRSQAAKIATDKQLEKLRTALEDALQLDARRLFATELLGEAASAFSATLKIEAQLASNDSLQELHGQLLSQMRLVLAACHTRHAFFATMATQLFELMEALTWAEEELGRRCPALEADYPPSCELLQDLERRLWEAQEAAERVNLELKFARRRGRATQELEARAAELRSQAKADRLDLAIMRERARLYTLAWEHFPELLLPGQAGGWSRLVGLDASGGLCGLRERGLLAEGRRFSDFEAEPVGAAAGGPGSIMARRRVYKAVYRAEAGGSRCMKVWALKEFSLMDDGGGASRALWRHFATLDGLQHPKLAAVCAVFEDPVRGSAFLQMPWYPGGDLEAWLVANPPSSRLPQQCKQMLVDIAEALEHIQRHGHTHCDVKPGNMFLTESRRLVLGGFDCIAGSGGAGGGLLTCTLKGDTLGYLAPELIMTGGQQQRFTPACDIYALGVVARQLLTGVDLQREQQLPSQQLHAAKDEEAEEANLLASLLDRMTHNDSTKRPSATEVLQDPFLKAASAEAAAEELASCVVCWDTKRRAAGAHCTAATTAGRHFTCGTCLSAFVASVAGSEQARHLELANLDGALPCPAEACPGRLPPADMMCHLTTEACKQYHEALRSGLEGRTAMRLETDYEQRLAELLAELVRTQAKADGTQEERALRAEQHVIENILTLKCPRCSVAIFDFDGCFAITCARCGAGLCGWCLQDCGKDAHPHVAVCRWNESPGGNGIYFAPHALFEKSANRRRSLAVQRYVEGLDGELRRLVKKRLMPHMQALGIQEALNSC